jgi:uncharacterized protein (DUF983 family)
MFEKRHIAKCSNCDHIAETRSSGTFIPHFALPSMCEGCGEHMHERANDLPHWLHVIVKLERVKPTRNRNPLTWFRMPKWVEIERHEMHAR